MSCPTVQAVNTQNKNQIASRKKTRGLAHLSTPSTINTQSFLAYAIFFRVRFVAKVGPIS